MQARQEIHFTPEAGFQGKLLERTPLIVIIVGTCPGTMHQDSWTFEIAKEEQKPEDVKGFITDQFALALEDYKKSGLQGKPMISVLINNYRYDLAPPESEKEE